MIVGGGDAGKPVQEAVDGSPRATNVPTRSLLDESGRFLPVSELESILGDYRSGRTITYCGGGIAASGLAFAMTLAGIEDVAVHTNSLQEWTLDPTNPMAVSTPDGEND